MGRNNKIQDLAIFLCDIKFQECLELDIQKMHCFQIQQHIHYPKGNGPFINVGNQ